MTNNPAPLPHRQSLVAQTAAFIKQQIDAGAWREVFPSERKLCDMLSVSRVTVSKRGEDGIGWQLRRMGGDPIAGFTVRGVDNEDGWGSSINVNDGNWHHYVGIWDQATGTRRLYVDGNFSHVVNNNPSQTLSMAPARHLALGAREQGGTGFEGFFTGLLFDVRIYNDALSEAKITSLLTAPELPPSLTIQHWTGNQVRISWPVAAVGFTLQQSSAVPGGWANSGLVIAVEGTENAAYSPLTGNGLFYRLAK